MAQTPYRNNTVRGRVLELEKIVDRLDRSLFNYRLKTDRAILSEIKDRLKNLDVTLSGNDKRDLKLIKTKVLEITQDVMSKYEDQYLDEVVDLAYKDAQEYNEVLARYKLDVQNKFTPKTIPTAKATLFVAAQPMPPYKDFKRAFENYIAPMTDKRIRSTYKSFSKWFTQRNINKINQLHLDGLTPHDITIKAHSEILPHTTAKQFKTLHNTAVGIGREVSREQVEKNYKEFIKGFEYSAHLDTRTTEYCRRNNGKFYRTKAEAAKDGVMIMSHYNCRSVWIPIPKEEGDY